jgi:biopolymer transport protein ExbB/TolQ
MLELLSRTLLLISNALLVPVILAIFVLLSWTVILCGGLAREWMERRKLEPLLTEVMSSIRDHVPMSLAWRCLEQARSGLPRRFVRYVHDNRKNPTILDQSIAMVENDVAASLARHSFITRVAPIFGLMGTLIPLGPALSGLAAGNMQALSGNLIVAFTATVVGLLISGLSYGMGLIRRVWYSRDVAILEAFTNAAELKQEQMYAR